MLPHPVAVHFPIALLTLAVFTDLMSYFLQKEFFRKATLMLLITGLLGAIISYNTGQEAAEIINNLKSVEALLDQHQNSALWLIRIYSFCLTGYIFQFFFKKAFYYVRIVISLLMLLGFLQIYQTGLFGGKLVFEKGVGGNPLMEILKNEVDSE